MNTLGCAAHNAGQGAAHGPAPHEAAPTKHFVAEGLIPVGAEDAVVGSEDALITIVAFFDYEAIPNAPEVGATARHTLDQVMHDYGPAVRVVLKHDPMYFHPQARQAAIASQVVLENLGPKWFFSYTKRIIDNEYGSSDEFLETAATELGLALAIYRKGLQDPRHGRKVEADMALAKQIGDGLAPPLFAINGVVANGARPHLWFSGVIHAEMQPARALRDSGLSPREVYEHRVAHNIANPPQRHHHPSYEPERDEIRTERGASGDEMAARLAFVQRVR
jgi:hypothetical protein